MASSLWVRNRSSTSSLGGRRDWLVLDCIWVILWWEWIGFSCLMPTWYNPCQHCNCLGQVSFDGCLALLFGQSVSHESGPICKWPPLEAHRLPSICRDALAPQSDQWMVIYIQCDFILYFCVRSWSSAKVICTVFKGYKNLWVVF